MDAARDGSKLQRTLAAKLASGMITQDEYDSMVSTAITGYAQQAIRAIARIKSTMNPQHSYGLAALGQQPTWLLEFSSDPGPLIDMVDQLTPQVAVVDQKVDLAPLFDRLLQAVDVPKLLVNGGEVVRVLLFYGRVGVPYFSSTASRDTLLQLPGVFIDCVVFPCQGSSARNEAELNQFFLQLDPGGHRSYLHTTTGTPEQVVGSTATLLAHPLQRLIQKDTRYTLEAPPESL
eukprot:gene4931-9930_t